MEVATIKLMAAQIAASLITTTSAEESAAENPTLLAVVSVGIAERIAQVADLRAQGVLWDDMEATIEKQLRA